jgi:hypothetical protein
MNVIAVDPGVHWAGLAIFSDARLRHACLIVGSDEEVPLQRALLGMAKATSDFWHESNRWLLLDDAVLVVEKPQIYTRNKGRAKNADKNDLIDVSLSAGVVIAQSFMPTTKLVSFVPHDWKGDVEKSIMTERIKGWVTEEERALVPHLPKKLAHNVWDAIGLGIHQLEVLGLRRKGPPK